MPDNLAKQKIRLRPGQIVLIASGAVDFAELLRGHSGNGRSDKVPHVSSHNEIDSMSKSSPGDHCIFKIAQRIDQRVTKVNLRHIKDAYDVN